MAKEPEKKADPVGKPKEPEKVEVLDIPANEPYPTGNPPEDPGFEAAHGKRAGQKE
jgi:hypothetical protein